MEFVHKKVTNIKPKYLDEYNHIYFMISTSKITLEEALIRVKELAETKRVKLGITKDNKSKRLEKE